MTPEGKVKAYLRQRLKPLPGSWFFMPVKGTAIGQNAAPDLLFMYRGQPVGIEVKATSKKKATLLQAMTLYKIEASGNHAWLVDNETVDHAIEVITGGFQMQPQAALFRWREVLLKAEGNALKRPV